MQPSPLHPLDSVSILDQTAPPVKACVARPHAAEWLPTGEVSTSSAIASDRSRSVSRLPGSRRSHVSDALDPRHERIVAHQLALLAKARTALPGAAIPYFGHL